MHADNVVLRFPHITFPYIYKDLLPMGTGKVTVETCHGVSNISSIIIPLDFFLLTFQHAFRLLLGRKLQRRISF